MRFNLDRNIDIGLRTDFANASGIFVKDGENVGSGVDIFKQKNSNRNLEFRTIVAGSGIQIIEDMNNIQIDSAIVNDLSILESEHDQLRTDFDNASGTWIKNAENVGIGSNIFDQKSGSNLQFRRILQGSGIIISTSGNTLRIDNTLEDDINELSNNFINSSGNFVKNAQNIGVGSGLFIQKNNQQILEFRTIIPGSGVQIVSASDELSIDSTVIPPQNVLIVQKNAGPGQFSSIKTAVDSIVGSSPTNPFLVRIYPGIYTENTIIIPGNVAIIGESSSVVTVQPSNANDDIFQITSSATRLQNITIRNATGVDAAGIRITSSTIPSNITFVGITNCYYNIVLQSSTTPIAIVGQFLRISGGAATRRLVHVESTLGQSTIFRLFSSNGQDSTVGSLLTDAFFVTGSGASAELTGVIVQSTVGIGNGITLENAGRSATFGGYTVQGFNKNFVINNVGSGPTIELSSASMIDGIVKDIEINHAGANGFFTGIANPDKVTVDSDANISLLFNHGNSNIEAGISVIGDLFIGHKFNSITNITDLIQRTTSIGVIEGGALSSGISPLSINVASGFGYCENNITERSKFIEWDNETIILPNNSNSFIYVDSSGVVQSALSSPDEDQNILLGRAVTFSSGITYISRIPVEAEHSPNKNNIFLRQAIGPVYTAGSIVTEGSPARSLNVTNGTFFYSSLDFHPTGGSGITFLRYFHSGGNFTQGSSSTVVSNTQFDNGTDLTSLTLLNYTKHTLYIIGNGADEQYALVYGQAQYATLIDAENGDLSTPPTHFTDSVVPIAAIIVRQGTAAIQEILDIRPRIGFAAPSLTTVSDHGNLLGLLDDDHPQYLLVNGTRAMTDSLDMGGENIINVATVDGVDVFSHQSRHLPNGADPLTTAAPVTIGTTNSVGTANSLSRSDHLHSHGDQAGGSLHAVATSGSAGFMSASDKIELSDIRNDFTNASGNWVKTASNVGASGTGLFKQKTGSDLEFKKLVAGSGISLIESSNSIRVYNQEEIVVKHTSETINADAVLGDDAELKFNVKSNGIYVFELHLLAQAAAANPDWKVGWSVPLGTTMLWGPILNDTDFYFGLDKVGDGIPGLLTETSTNSFAGLNGTTGAYYRGNIFVGSTAGQIILQWCQNTSHASNSTLRRGSFIKFRKLI